jgi:hypothetical protein
VKIEKFLFNIEQEMKTIARDLCETPVDRHERYQRLVGEYAGLKRALMMARTMSRVDEDDEVA